MSQQRALVFRDFVLLPALGALLLCASTEGATTMNIEIDYMVGATHSHMPQPDEVAAVVQMFACRGIILNIVVDQALPHSVVLFHDPDNTNNFFNYSGVTNSFGYLRDHYFGHKNESGWHYCIFGHQFEDNYKTSGSSGLGELPGKYFVVTLGAFASQIGTPFDRAATLAHEFGHNLGLVHGASGDYQPNKPSIMSYFYQLRGVCTALIESGLATPETSLFKELDYSDGTMCTLDESSLEERFGSGMVPTDWGCDGQIGGVISRCIDDWGNWCYTAFTNRHILADVNEWGAIQDTTWSKSTDDAKAPSTVSCITFEESAAYLKSRFTQAQPPVVAEPCVRGRMIYLRPGLTLLHRGLCSDPITTLELAQRVATEGSHLFLIPGNYTTDSGPLVLDKPMTIFCNIGMATVNPQFWTSSLVTNGGGLQASNPCDVRADNVTTSDQTP